MIGHKRILAAMRNLAAQNEILTRQVEVADAKATAALHFAGFAVTRKPEDLATAQEASRRFDELAAQLKAFKPET